MIDKAPEKIRKMFDEISPRYDLLNHLLSLNTDILWRRRAARWCEPGQRVLDLCCGTGDLSLEMEENREASVVGIDFSQNMVRHARKKAEKKSHQARFFQGDALNLSVSDETFDVVTVAFGIRNVISPARALSEMKRVLRPGGRMIILEFTLPPSRLLRTGYLFYFSQVLPRIGKLIARAEMDAYRYLPDSVREWPSPDRFSDQITRAGFEEVEHELLFFGVAAIHTALCPA
jgi:demethylmenaquinone methyltransferase/2-methoxy-6-polyprenyl-1,4-benzoquinol methylase